MILKSNCLEILSAILLIGLASAAHGDPVQTTHGLTSDESKAVFQIVDDVVRNHFLVVDGNYYYKTNLSPSETDYIELKGVGYNAMSPDPVWNKAPTSIPTPGFKSVVVFLMDCGKRTARLGIGSLGAGLPFKWSAWEKPVAPNSDLENYNPDNVIHLIEVQQPPNILGNPMPPLWYLGVKDAAIFDYYRIKPAIAELPKAQAHTTGEHGT